MRSTNYIQPVRKLFPMVQSDVIPEMNQAELSPYPVPYQIKGIPSHRSCGVTRLQALCAGKEDLCTEKENADEWLYRYTLAQSAMARVTPRSGCHQKNKRRDPRLHC